ncbi:MAG: hypothetical protein HY072_03520 [Deltaproteobacteria bacterium]|nr:hypothetical protein [Deltaproteobacteria bacterium]
MGVYARFKRNPDGFRALVELLETTPPSRRQRMIEVGMDEDPHYTELALKYVLNFKDIINLPDVELAEVMAKAPSRSLAYALNGQSEDVIKKFLRNSPNNIAAEIRDYLAINVGPREIGGAQIKVITIARELERKGLVRTKIIPAAV